MLTPAQGGRTLHRPYTSRSPQEKSSRLGRHREYAITPSLPLWYSRSRISPKNRQSLAAQSTITSPAPFPDASSSQHPHPTLHLQTALDFSQAPISPFTHANRPPAPAALIPQAISPTHLNLYNFGSRFLPHTTSPIRCLLPLNNHHMLLIGHDDGLSVLDMFPTHFPEHDEPEKGPSDAVAKLIWEGEGWVSYVIPSCSPVHIGCFV